MSHELIIDQHGTIKKIDTPYTPNIPEEYPDKKRRFQLYKQTDEVLIRSRQIVEAFEIGQKEATWMPTPEYPELPLMILLMTDTHYGSARANTNLINEHLDIVKETPNFYMVHNGDHVDNFNAVVGLGDGTFEDPLPPQIASRAWAEKLMELDKLKKIGVLGFGNHDDFGAGVGQDWYDTFLSKFRCPIFTSGGLLHILLGDKVVYDLAMQHKYWGYSKLNPTNTLKRLQEHEYPDADILFTGHTHQSEGLHFERGGKDRIGVVGGTYKDEDVWARKQGIGGRAGQPGWVVALWQNERKMVLFKDIKVAQDFLLDKVFRVHGI